jgi:alkylated DNA nucleotide flippase Atl1
VSSRPAPRDLRASDADREQVFTLLSEAAADGRLTLDEHADRAGQAQAARTLGQLTALTADLAAPAAQPIRLDGRRAVSGVFARERRDGRWVVPASFPVTAIFGEVVLDLRGALLQSQRTVVYATVIAGHLELIVPEGVTVQVTGKSVLSRRVARGSPPPAAGQLGPGQPVIEVRAVTVGGTVRTTTPRRSRWRTALRRGRAGY